MRVFVFVLLLLTATLLGGIYGAVYDQFTFSISPEFYTKMRFPIYGVTSIENSRWEVAKIGFKISWSVGFGLGLFLTLAGLLHATIKKMIWVTLQSFFIALFTAFVFGIVAYFLVEPDLEAIKDVQIVDKFAFGKVTSMTNYSYVGGTIGMFLGIAWQVLNTRLSK